MSAKRKSISSDLKRLDKMKDEDIDYSDIPSLDESLLDEKTMVQKACEELVDAGWIRLEPQAHEFGRPLSPTYLINPKLKICTATEKNFF